MAWALNADRPIYAQLVDRIQLQIVAGQLKPGEKILSVRELAAEAAVNPNTMPTVTISTSGRSGENVLAGHFQMAASGYAQDFWLLFESQTSSNSLLLEKLKVTD